LILRKDGKWFLLVTVDLPDSTKTPTSDFIGVDFGVQNLATSSDGEHFSGAGVDQTRERYHEQRRKLQQAGEKRTRRGSRPKQIRRKLKNISQRESRFRRHTNHCISKTLVAQAKDTERGIALEDLKGIRARTRFRKPQRARMSGWSFFQLRAFIEYKAKLAGVPVFLVEARHTSRTCSQCGHCEKANRPSQAVFECRQCGFATHADYNAALNIRARAAVSAPKVSEQAVRVAA
jgi:IS605 OrfB family transposase